MADLGRVDDRFLNQEQIGDFYEDVQSGPASAIATLLGHHDEWYRRWEEARIGDVRFSPAIAKQVWISSLTDVVTLVHVALRRLFPEKHKQIDEPFAGLLHRVGERGEDEEVGREMSEIALKVDSAHRFAEMHSRLADVLDVEDSRRGVTSYEFSDEDYEKIQVAVSRVRNTVRKSKTITEKHRERILKAVERVQRELNKRMSNFDRFWGLIFATLDYTHEAGKKALPIAKDMQEIVTIVARTKRKIDRMALPVGLEDLVKGLPAGVPEDDDETAVDGDGQEKPTVELTDVRMVDPVDGGTE